MNSTLERVIEEVINNKISTSKNIVTPIINNDYKDNKSVKVFLGGTIDSGNSEDWQRAVCLYFLNDKDITIFNPRRTEWPKDSDKKEVVKQIKWEHEKLDECDYIIMNILSDSKSPISLMEIGMYCRSKKIIVFCPNDYYRFDNVELVCQKYNIPLFLTNNIKDIINVINLLKDNNKKWIKRNLLA